MNDVAEIWLSLSWILGCLISQHQLLQVILKNPHLPALAFSSKGYVKNCVTPKTILVFGISFQDVLKVA